jgi:NADH:ubiquinone oxidoreductase subunit 2 (subunit N)
MAHPWLVALGVAGVLNSVVSLFYYTGVLKRCFLEQPREGAGPVALPGWYTALQAIGALAAP